MSLLTPSLAADDDIRAYTAGDSHTLAVALHRRFGWRMMVVTDARDPFWKEPGNGDGDIPSVVHVYAVDGNGDAWDIRGKRPVTAARDDCYSYFNVQDFYFDDCDDEDDLSYYVGVWSDNGEPVERPLPYYSEQDIADAEAVIVRVFPNVPVAMIEATLGQPRFPR